MKYLFIILLIPIFIFSKEKNIQKNLPNVVFVTTGGTIAEKTDPKTGGSVPTLTGNDLVEEIPTLKKIANIDVVNFSNIDSSQMTLEIWKKLAKKVDELLKDDKYIGAVITHGTDTMAVGAYFLDLTLSTNKPVVFTGSMKDASDPCSDGIDNIINATIQVCSTEANGFSVTVTMNQYINSARDVRKTNTTNPQTFNSGEKGYLGYVFDGKVYKINDVLYRFRLPMPEELDKVNILMDYAGSDGSFIRFAVDRGARGIVVDGVGAGNVNDKTFDAIKYAISKKVAVVIATRVLNGGVYPIYGDKGGGKALKDIGAIVAGNLDPEKARVLLTLTLPIVKDDHQKLYRFFAIPK